MAVLPVADDIDDDVFAELLPELGGDFGDVDDGVGIVAVYVEDRRIHHASHV